MIQLALLFALGIDLPLLTLDTGSPTLLGRDALLARPELKHIHIDSPDFGGQRDMPAIALADLLGNAGPPDGTVQVTCADGFVADLPRAQALQRDPHKPMAYLAIDPLDGTWPTEGRPYPGPFAVVWTVPPGTTVAREQWPYAVVRIGLGGTLAQRYPLLPPTGPAAAIAAESRGFLRFSINCLPCHTLNGQGPAEVGPDLNIPTNPLEYLGKARFTAYVRDPQSLHQWKTAHMPPFPESILSKADLDDLTAYLAERLKHR